MYDLNELIMLLKFVLEKNYVINETVPNPTQVGW